MSAEDPAEHDVEQALRQVRGNITEVSQRLGLAQEPRLVAVSKTKSKELVQYVYDLGQRHFGENYVQELIDKAPQLPDDIQWHFIGSLQSNKCKALLNIKNLYMLETISSVKLARKLGQTATAMKRPEPLKVLIQVNTSDEETKSGVEPEEVFEVYEEIIKHPSLKFAGFMCIGRAKHIPDFDSLKSSRDSLCEKYQLNPANLELSMGMSGDYVLAIEHGSTNVRVGSTIFGERSYPPKK